MPTYEFFSHFRFQAMCHFLRDVSTPEAIYGHIARLEAHLVRDRNDVARQRGIIDPQEIEGASHWFEHAGRFLDALTRSGLIIPTNNGRVLLRGWENHAPYFVKRRIQHLPPDEDNATTGEGSESTPELQQNYGGTSPVNICRPKSKSRRKSKSMENDPLSKISQCHQSQRSDTEEEESGKICTDTEDAEKAKTETEQPERPPAEISQRTKTGILKALSAAELTVDKLKAYGPLGVHILLNAVGVDDPGFRLAVGNAIKHNPHALKDLIELCGMVQAKRTTVKKPGAWLRKSLRQRGLEI